MVAIVSGNSLGLELTSLGTLGSQGTSGLAGQGNNGEQVFVNAATGNLVVQHKDDFLASLGLDNMALRTYNSLGLATDDNADNWSMGVYAQQMLLTGTVNQVGSTLTRTARDGSQAVYTWDATRLCYITRLGGGAHDTIVYNSTALQYQRTDGSTREVEKYSSTNGRLLSVTDADGKTLTYTYNNTTGLLTSVVDSSGETIWYDYSGTKLTRIRTQFTDANGVSVTRSSVTYAYNTNRLSSVTVDLTPEDNAITDGIVYTTNYTYDGTSKRIKTLTQSDGSSLTFSYVLVGADYRVDKITDAVGAVTKFAYNTTTRRTTVTDPLGKVWQYDYDTAGQLTKLTQPQVDGAKPAQIFVYDADGNLLKATGGDGKSVNYVYDANGNCVQETDDQSNFITRTFSATNQLLTESTTTLVAAPVINQGGVTVDGTTVVKSNGADGQWDSAFRSSDSIVYSWDGTAHITFQPSQNDKAFVIGLNSDPATSHSIDSIDYALYFRDDGRLEVWHNGQMVADVGSYESGDFFDIQYAYGQIDYFRNNDTLYTDENVPTGQAFYADSSFRDVGAAIEQLNFGDPFPLVAPNGVTVADGTVKKLTSTSAWDASVRGMYSMNGPGSVTFHPAQVDRSFMMGLNGDAAADDAAESLDWAFWCSDESVTGNTSNLYVSENGVTTLVGTYKSGDELRVVYYYGEITYVQNGNVLLTRQVSDPGELFLDSSFYHPDAKVTGVFYDRFGGEGNNKIVAISQESAIKISGDSANKVGGTDQAWDSAIRSRQGFTGGANVSFAATRTDRTLMVGLSKNPNASYDGAAIDWAMLCTGTGQLQASENGHIVDLGTSYAVTDRLQVTYDGTAIKYLKNGAVLRTVTVSINQPLYLDSSFYNIGARVTILSFGDSVLPDLTARYVYSATKPSQLRFAISPAGRVTQYTYDSNGLRTAEIDYPASAYSLAGLLITEVPTEAQMAQWVGAQDLSKTVRKDYGYDARGLLSTLTEYESTLSNGNGNTQTARQTLYIYDQAGRLLKSIQPSVAGSDEAGASVSIYAYDGLGRMLSVKDAYGTVSSTVYSDSTQTAVVSYRGVAVATSVYDKAGHLVSQARSSNGSTTYAYDAGGHLLMSTDPTGARTFFLHDAAGRRSASIDADGTLTEYSYDRANRLTHEVTYSTAVSLDLLYSTQTGKPVNPSLGSIRPAASSNDIGAWHVYDSAGRLVYDIGDDGALTAYEYDGASRVLRTTRFATLLDDVSSPTMAWVQAKTDSWTFRESAAQDRVVRNFYDNDGLLTGSLDGEGYLTRRTYDQAGRLVSVRRYATKLEDQLRLTGTLEAVTPAASNDDQVDVYFYDARGQLVGQVDAERYLTVNSYNERGQLRSQIRYATALAQTPATTAKLSDLIASIRTGGTLQADDRQNLRYYDLDGKLRTEVNFEGTSTRYEYDAARNLIKTTVGVNEADARSPLARYDAWGRKTDELSAQAALLLVGVTDQTAINIVWQTYGSHYTYDAANRLTSATDANQNKTLYYYDVDGRLTHTINAMREVEERKYNALGQLVTTIRYGTALTSLTGLNGGLVNAALTQAIIADVEKDSVTRFEYDDNGRLSKEIDAFGSEQYTDYNQFGEVRERYSHWFVPDRDGHARNSEVYAYDRRGVVTLQTRELDGDVLSAVTTELDAFGRVVKTDSNGLTHEWKYDRLGRVVQTINAHDPARVTTYDAFGQVLTVTDELQKTTVYTYDRQNRSVTMTTPEGVIVKTVHDRYGQVFSVKDGNDVVTSYGYDRDGRLKETRVNGDVVQHQDYDNGGRLVTAFDARETITRYTYDAANRTLTRTVDPTDTDLNTKEVNLQTRWEYDAKGQAWRVTDPNGTVTEYTFELDGRTASQIVDPNGLRLTTSWSYDSEGQRMTVTDANGVVTNHEYDSLGRLKRQVVLDSEGEEFAVRSYSYDPNDNVLSATDAAGHTTRYRYDVNDRLEYTIDGTGGVTRNLYDERGELSRQIQYAARISGNEEPSPNEPTSGDRVTRYYYDNDGRLQFTVDPYGALTRTDYDDNDNVVKLTRYADTLTANQLPSAISPNADGQVTLIEYDQFNRESWRADSANGVTHSEYDDNGNLVKRTSYLKPLDAGLKPSQVTRTPGQDRVEQFIYDAANRQTWHSDATGAVTHTEYDGDNITRVTQFSRSALGVSPDAVQASPGLDRVSRFFYDDSGRLEFNVDAAGGVTKFEYDDNGNVVRQTRYYDTLDSGEVPDDLDFDARDQVTRFKYDAANRETWRANAMGEVTHTEYDGNGSVLSRTRFDATVTAGADIDSVETHSDTDRTERFVYDDADRNTWWSDAAGDVTRTTYDAFGSVVEVIRFANTAFGASPDTVAPKPGEDRVTSFVYDTVHHYRYEVDSLGYVTRLDYDAFGNVTASRRYADKPNSRGEPATAAANNSLDRTQGFEYDGANRLTKSIDVFGATEVYTYDTAGNRLTYKNKNNDVWTYTYDAVGRLLTETSPEVDLYSAKLSGGGVDVDDHVFDPVVTTLTYDSFGNVKTRTEATGRLGEERTTTYDYDLLGRQVKVTYPSVKVYDESLAELAANNRLGESARDEITKPLFVRTFYDSFGNAVSSIGINGAVSYKSYDAAGRVTFEVDALGAVTGYERNAFGEAFAVTRYGVATALNSTAAADAARLITTTSVRDAVNANAHVADRVLINGYDLLGRVNRVVEPTAFVYDGASGASGLAAKETKSIYNAFGELTHVSQRAGISDAEWLDTFSYYDIGGRKTASVDAGGFLTTFEYDSEGNLKTQVEYAKALGANQWNEAGHADAVPVEDEDRTTTWTWDRLNRKLSETKAHVKTFVSSTTTNVNTAFLNLTTSYHYDAVGNLVWTLDSAGGKTYSFYDALGRVRAVVAPARIDQYGLLISPVTEFLRDAFGNVVCRIDRATTATITQNEDDYSVGTSAYDHVTKTRYDLAGHALQTEDAAGFQHYFSYTAAGEVAKSWQTVTDIVNSNTQTSRTVYAAYTFDKLGRLVASYAPSPEAGETVSTDYDYNVFGELKTRGKNGGSQESYLYDNAGRMWKTNTGDGYATVFLYDVLGRQTAEISSAGSGRAGSKDVNTARTAQEAAGWTDTRRINTEYNALGQVVVRNEAGRNAGGSTSSSTVTVRDASVGATVASSAYPRWYEDPHPGRENMLVDMVGTTSVDLSWTTLARLGSGDIRVDLTYLSKDTRFARPAEGGGIYYESGDQGSAPERRTESQIFTGSEADDGVRLNWDESYAAVNGGISAIERLVVYKRDANGDWVKVIDRDPAAGDYGTRIEISAPTEGGTTLSLRYRAVGASQWTYGSLSQLGEGDDYWFDAGLLGRCEYEVLQTPEGGSAEVIQSGTFGELDTRNASAAGHLLRSATIERLESYEGSPYIIWSGFNTLSFGWTTLAHLGGGDVRVDVSYQTVGNAMSASVTRSRSQVFAAGDASQGVTLEWTDPATELDSGVGGVSKINHFEVYKRDADGAWVKVVDRNPSAGRGFGDYGTRVEIAAPANASTAVGFRYRVIGTSQWITASLGKLGNSYWSDFGALSGNYEFEVLQTPQGGMVEVTRTGKFVGGKDGTSSSGAAAAEFVQPVVVFTRDRWGNALTQSDPRHSDWLTYFTYNRDNQVASEKRPDAFLGTLTDNSPTRHIYFDELGRQRAVQDERGFVNTTEWDAGGNLVSEMHADGGQVTYFYDAFGQRTRMVDAVGNGKVGESNAPSSAIYREHTTRYTYDLLGRQLSTIHGNTTSGAVGVWGVDEDDYHLVSMGRANLTESFTYDELGHKISSTNGAGEKTTYRYDLAGNLIETRLPGGQTSSVSYTINDDGGMTRTEIDANHNDTTWTYDYFGKLIGHTDLGDAEYTYVYDSAGQLIRQTNERGQNLRYTYDAAGGLIRIEDLVSHQTTNYVLDLAGRHLRETVDVSGEVFEDNHLAYDILGRLIDSADNRAHLTFDYDEAGNRTRVTTHVLVAEVNDPDTETLQEGSRFFVYDEMNRQTAVDAVNAQGGIDERQGHQLTYDLNGNRVTDLFWGNVVKSVTRVIRHIDYDTHQVTYESVPDYEKTQGFVLETYDYDAVNRLVSVDRDDTVVDLRSYDGAGRLVHSGPSNLPLDFTEKLNDGVPADQQIGMEVRSMRYDVNGRLLFQRTWKSNGTSLKYDIDYRDRQVSDYNELTGEYTWSTVESYDDAGNVLHYKFANHDGEDYNNYTSIELARYEGYVEKKTVTNSTEFDPGTSISSYDANGYLIGVDDLTEDSLDKQIVNDAAGRVLRVTQSGNKLWTHMVNGQIMGRYGVGPNEMDSRTKKNEANFQQVADFEFGYRSISGNYPAPGVGSYTVRQGDSLQSIAQGAFGDSGQWWRIAQANGLQSDRDLRVGQTLTLPNVISGTSNSESTFKPYNSSDVIGDTSPNLPQPKASCDVVASVIIIVIAIVVTYLTYGATVEYCGPLVAGALSGAAGSVASQAAGNVLGVQKGFDWKQVATSAIGGAIGAGLAEYGGQLMQNTIVRAAVSNAMTQTVSVAVGAQDAFSWKGVAAAAVGAAAGEAINSALLGDMVGKNRVMDTAFAKAMGNDAVAKIVSGTLAGIASGAAVSMLRGGRFSLQQVAADAFGNALGSSIADSMQSSGVDWSKAPDQSDAEWQRLKGYESEAARASLENDEANYLSRAAEERLQNRATRTDYGDDYGGAGDVEATTTQALRRGKGGRQYLANGSYVEKTAQGTRLVHPDGTIDELWERPQGGPDAIRPSRYAADPTPSSKETYPELEDYQRDFKAPLQRAHKAGVEASELGYEITDALAPDEYSILIPLGAKAVGKTAGFVTGLIREGAKEERLAAKLESGLAREERFADELGENVVSGGSVRDDWRPYLTRDKTADIANQTGEYTCGPTCAVSVLRGHGVQATEEKLVELAGTIDKYGTDPTRLANAMTGLLPNDSKAVFRGGYMPNDLDPDRLFNTFTPSRQWLMQIGPESGPPHYVVVEGIEKSGAVSILDPWRLENPGVGDGLRATIDRQQLMKLWEQGKYGFVYPTAR